MFQKPCFLIALLTAASCSALVGCGQSHPTAPIRGTVTIAGKPVGPGVVILQPDGPPTEPSLPSTMLSFGPDGQFSGEAPVGKHQVIIQSQAEEEFGRESREPVAARSKIPAYYADPARSELKVEVTDSENELPPFDLKPYSSR